MEVWRLIFLSKQMGFSGSTLAFGGVTKVDAFLFANMFPGEDGNIHL